ncbi:MAG: hypothetical protein K2K93_09535, partial [Muribaculaceae bacterium]|nr:hypothetical protein [Muribaculaceae bacterium]
ILQGSGGFSPERFFRLAKSDFIINKGTYLKLILATTGVFIALAVMISVNAVNYLNEMDTLTAMTGRDFNTNIDHRLSSYSQLYCSIGLWIVCLGLTISGSLTFSNLSYKRRRISTLMIPSSSCEKFMLRMMIYLLGGIVTLIVGYLVGILIMQLTFGGLDLMKEGLHGIVENIHKLGVKIGNRHLPGCIAALVIVFLLSYASIYTLGSSLWPRLSWLKTWIVLTVLQWIAAIVLITVVLSGFDIEKFINFDLANKVTTYIYALIVTFSTLNVICWVLAWLRFKNTQIIQRFMKR